MGNIFVGSGEPGREFTQEDEEVLVMFASQAAQVIANARSHRDEQRARAGLETLIDTSPVGVAVFSIGTGALVSFNREGGGGSSRACAMRTRTRRICWAC